MARGGVAPVSLAELRERWPKGWWDELDPDGAVGEDATMDSDRVAVVSPERPLALLPNPFNPRTEVHFYVEKAGFARVNVCDLRGRHVSPLLQEHRSAGPHQITWKGEDGSGASGLQRRVFCGSRGALVYARPTCSPGLIGAILVEE